MKIDISDLLHVIGKAVQNCEQLLTVYYCPLINTKCYISTFDTFKDTTIKICDDRRLVVTSSFVFYVITFQTCSAPQNDCLNLSFVKDIYVDGGNLARNGQKMTNYISWVSQVRKNIFAFCVITSEPIEVQTRSAPQNDRLNLSFVKDICVNGRKLARNGRKMAIRLGRLGQILLSVILSSHRLEEQKLNIRWLM